VAREWRTPGMAARPRVPIVALSMLG